MKMPEPQSYDKALRKVSAAQFANLATYQQHVMDATPYVNPLRNSEFLSSYKCMVLETWVANNSNLAHQLKFA